MKTPNQLSSLFPFQQKFVDGIQKMKGGVMRIPLGCGKAYILLHYALQHPNEKIIIALPYIEAVQITKLFIDHKVKNVVIITSQ